MVRSVLLCLFAAAMGACVARRPVECSADTDCDLMAGGRCDLNGATGNTWCSFPDSECPSGQRFATLDVGDGLAGMCVSDGGEDMVDAGLVVDAAADAATVSSWLQAGGGTDVDSAKAIAVDLQRNVYVTGSFRFMYVSGTTNLMSAGGSDVFVLKYGPTGDVVWARRFGAAGDDAGVDVALAPDGSPVVLGWFNGTVDFAGTSLGSMGMSDQFIAKLSPVDGSVTWVARQGSTNREEPSDIAVSSDGSIATVGMFEGQTNLGGSNLTDVSAALGSIYVAKFRESDGGHVWSRALGGNGFGNSVADVGFAGAGTQSVVVAGAIDGTGSVGAGNVTSAGVKDFFLSGFAGATGVNTFARLFGGANNEEPLAMTIVALTAEIYVTGWFNQPVSLGGPSVTGTNDLFVARYDGSGTHLWSTSFGGARGMQQGRAISVSESGTVAVGAYISGPTTIGSTLLTPDGDDGAVILVQKTDGVALGSYQVGGANYQSVEAIHVLNDSFVVAGDFISTISALGFTRSGNGMKDAFVGFQRTQ